jgi:hypothetical protein
MLEGLINFQTNQIPAKSMEMLLVSILLIPSVHQPIVQ